jgi:hypothetical protein
MPPLPRRKNLVRGTLFASSLAEAEEGVSRRVTVVWRSM